MNKKTTTSELVNGYSITKCPECGKHYIINNPLSNEEPWECWLTVTKMTKTQAIARAKELIPAKKAADIYNYNSKFSYK